MTDPIEFDPVDAIGAGAFGQPDMVNGASSIPAGAAAVSGQQPADI